MIYIVNSQWQVSLVKKEAFSQLYKADKMKGELLTIS